jgi:hypothetical protein
VPKIKSQSKLFTIPFYGNPLTPHVGYIQMVVTIAVVTKNVLMSRRWKAVLVAYEICLQPLLSYKTCMLLKMCSKNHAS